MTICVLSSLDFGHFRAPAQHFVVEEVVVAVPLILLVLLVLLGLLGLFGGLYIHNLCFGCLFVLFVCLFVCTVQRAYLFVRFVCCVRCAGFACVCVVICL